MYWFYSCLKNLNGGHWQMNTLYNGWWTNKSSQKEDSQVQRSNTSEVGGHSSGGWSLNAVTTSSRSSVWYCSSWNEQRRKLMLHQWQQSYKKSWFTTPLAAKSHNISHGPRITQCTGCTCTGYIHLHENSCAQYISWDSRRISQYPTQCEPVKM